MQYCVIVSELDDADEVGLGELYSSLDHRYWHSGLALCRPVAVLYGMPDFAWKPVTSYRIAAANEEHGNYILTAFYQMSFPIGEHQEGLSSPIITPTIAYGKGFKDFSVQGTLGGSFAHWEYSNLWANDLVEQHAAIPHPEEDLAQDRV